MTASWGVFVRVAEQVGDDLVQPALSRYVEIGLLHDEGTRVYLTQQGKYVADGVIEILL